MSETVKLTEARPLYDIGQVVSYTDRNDRHQVGAVLGVEARWASWSAGAPLIIYRVAHPTYRNGCFYTTDESITTPAGRQALREPK